MAMGEDRISDFSSVNFLVCFAICNKAQVFNIHEEPRMREKVHYVQSC